MWDMHYFGIRNRVTLLVLIATTKFPVLWHPYSALHSKWIISHLIAQEMVQQSKCPVRRSICLGKWCRLAMAASCQSKWPLNVVMKGESNQNSLFFVLFNAAKLGIFSTGDFMAILASSGHWKNCSLFSPGSLGLKTWTTLISNISNFRLHSFSKAKKSPNDVNGWTEPPR